MWDRRARLLRVKDGDTLVCVLDQGFGDTKEVDVRLLGVFAPETSEPGGPETTLYVQDWFEALPFGPWPFIVTTARMKMVDREQTTFDRYVATVTSLDGSRNLNVDVSAFIAAHGYGGGTGA